MSVSTSSVKDYYDAHTIDKLRGFVEGNLRVEIAWETIAAWAPNRPKRILEIGCGVGDICWRMRRRWPEAEVVGLDISARSIETARRLFGDEKLSFVEGELKPGTVPGPFDLIVLMDVYEHIAQAERPALHAVLRELRSPEGRIVLAFPTPRHLAHLREHEPECIQPIDEDVDVESVNVLARDTDTTPLLYRHVGVWHEGDYAHAVTGVWTGWKGVAGPRRPPTFLSQLIGLLRPPEPLVPSREQRLARVHARLGDNVYTAP